MLKDYLKKILYIVIFIACDIALFAFFVIVAFTFTGHSPDFDITQATTTAETEITTEITNITTTEKGKTEKSTSPLVNWMRKMLSDVRNK